MALIKNLSDKERQELTPRLVNGINYLDSRLQNPKYLKPTLINGLTAATETALGYFAGRLCSQIM